MKKNYFITILLFSFLGVYAQKDFTQIGNASFYGDEFVGKYTASGEKYDHNLLTAAHLTLPFGTKVKVTNYENNKSIVVKVNDRGPFVQGRIIDLSKSAAENLGIVDKGLAKVRVEVVKENTNGNTKPVKPAPVAQQPTQKPENPVVNKPVSSGKEIFKVDIEKTAEPGFGVQVASFNESFNFLDAISEIKKQVNEPVFINVTKQNDTVFYKVILGKVANRQQADALKKRLSNMFPGCFVVGF